MATETTYILDMDFMGGEVDFYPSAEGKKAKGTVVDQNLLSGNLLLSDESLFSDFGSLGDSFVNSEWSDKPDWFSGDPLNKSDSSQPIPSLEDVLEDVSPPLTPGGFAIAPSSDVGSPVPSDGGDEFLLGNYSPRTIANLEELLDHSALSATYTGESLSPQTTVSRSTTPEPCPRIAEEEQLSPVSPEVDSITFTFVEEAPQKKSGLRSSPYPKSSPKKQKSDEQKTRKRQQNRDAALRYRSKKKNELGVLVTEADKLEETNKKLKEQVLTVSKEIEYLKTLMLDVIKARLDNAV